MEKYFYRQSAVFVQYMKEYDPEKFKELLQAIVNEAKFDNAIHASYGRDIDAYWEKFKENLAKHISSDANSTVLHQHRLFAALAQQKTSLQMGFKSFLRHRYRSSDVNLYFFDVLSRHSEVQFEVDSGSAPTSGNLDEKQAI